MADVQVVVVEVVELAVVKHLNFRLIGLEYKGGLNHEDRETRDNCLVSKQAKY